MGSLVNHPRYRFSQCAVSSTWGDEELLLPVAKTMASANGASVMMEPGQAFALGLCVLRHLLPQKVLLGVVVFFATLAINGPVEVWT